MRPFDLTDLMVLVPRAGGGLVQVVGVQKHADGVTVRLVALDGAKFPEQLVESVRACYRPYWLQSGVVLTRPGRLDAAEMVSGEIHLLVRRGKLLDRADTFDGFDLRTLHDEAGQVRRDTSL